MLRKSNHIAAGAVRLLAVWWCRCLCWAAAKGMGCKLSRTCHKMGDSFTIQVSSNLVKQLADDGAKLNEEHTRKIENEGPLFMPVSRLPQFANAELDAIYSAVQESRRSHGAGSDAEPSLFFSSFTITIFKTLIQQ
ncbi:hypothetical protein Acr_14g0008350 [Actinidia rufa]|uniref:Uncharacterized protein n=1 Tax=Actinidia rufa TaxID=165716 RepID=A0A7J0FSP1_9ERIC|nr:hypothetical protein Acr_14g0008350 [Actinidia rufa]